MNILENEIITADFEEIIRNIGFQLIGKLEKQSLLITGANGFIGKYLTLFLIYLNQNYFQNKIKIIALANHTSIINQNFEKLINKYNGKIIKHNILNPVIFNEKIDYVIHAASITSPKTISENPLPVIQVNVHGTENILNAILNKNIKKFIYFSSSAIYGTPPPSEIPIPEDYNGNISPSSFRASYAESKRLAETILMLYHNLYKIPVNIVRPFHIYGPLMNLAKDNALNYILNCGFENKNIELNSPGQDTRSFCYITDALIIILYVALTDKIAEIFNIGNQKEEIKIIDLAYLVKNIYNAKILISINIKNANQFQKESLNRNVPNMKKVKKLFNFQPKIKLKEGLERVKKYHELNNR